MVYEQGGEPIASSTTLFAHGAHDRTRHSYLCGQEFRLPRHGIGGEKASTSPAAPGHCLITLDPGYANTGSRGAPSPSWTGKRHLRYRGIPVEQLAERSTFKETAYLLINGELPAQKELTRFSVLLNDHSLVHEDMKTFYQNFPRSSHPMGDPRPW
jgi:citrate synthase